MTLPSKFYETLKFIIKLCPWLISFISGLFLKLNIMDETTQLVIFCVSGAGALATLIVEFCKANHYKIKAENGTIKEIDYEPEEGEISQ